MKKVKKLLVLLSIVVFGLAMASCGSSNVTTPSDSVGLEFELSDNKDSYNVCSIGTCTDTDVVIPASYNGVPITSIGGHAFRGCSSLTSITIPNSVTSIGKGAFACSSLTSITIPFGVTSIGDWAFSGCGSLTSIAIPSGVTSIGESAFEDCSSLTSIEIPNSVTSIGEEAFSWCSSLTSITFTGTKEQWNNIYNTNQRIQSGVVVTCTDGTITIE